MKAILEALLPAPVKRVLRAKLHDWQRRSFRPYVTHLPVPSQASAEPIAFYVGDPVGELWYVRKDNAGKDSAAYMHWLLSNLLTPQDVILECGSHHGFYSVILARKLQEGHFTAVEAHPANAEILRKNVEINGLAGKVEVINAAVGRGPGVAELADASNAAVIAANGGDIPKIRVPMVSIDDLAQRMGRAVTLLKLDIEGMEVEALKGARSVLANVPKLNIEVHCQILRERRATPPEEVFACLPAGRYDFWIQPDDNLPNVLHINSEFSFQPYDRVQLFGFPRKTVS